jgi:hypothetical protein
MTCNRYWREGIVVVERGLDDPHRDGCEDCSRAHASRQELIEALPLVGASQAGDPHWQAKVWRRIDGEQEQGQEREREREHARPARRWRWQLSGALVVVCAVALWFGIGRTRDGEGRRYEIIPSEVAMRSSPIHTICDVQSTDRVHRANRANVGDSLRVKASKTSEVWIYREERLVPPCGGRPTSDGCVRVDRTSVEMRLQRSGRYHVLVVDDPVAAPDDDLNEARAALESVKARYDECSLSAQ